MTNYLEEARYGKISFTEAYARTHNAIVKLTQISQPTTEDFQKSEILAKQLKNISRIITTECMKKAGYTLNEKNQLWFKQVIN